MTVDEVLTTQALEGDPIMALGCHCHQVICTEETTPWEVEQDLVCREHSRKR